MSTDDRTTTNRLIDQFSHRVGQKILLSREDLRGIPRAISVNLERLREDLISHDDDDATPMTADEVDRLIVLTVAASDYLYRLVTDAVGEGDYYFDPPPSPEEWERLQAQMEKWSAQNARAV